MRNLKNSINNNQGVIAIVGIFVSVFISLSDGKLVAELIVIPGVGKPIVSFLRTNVPIYLVMAVIITFLSLVYLFLFFVLKYSKLTVLKASYGAGTSFIDIAAYLNKHIRNNKLNIYLTNSVIGRHNDPAPGLLKTCEIEYQVGKRILTKKYEEDELVKLPTIIDYIKWF